MTKYYFPPGSSVAEALTNLANEKKEENRIRRLELELKIILAVDQTQLSNFNPNLEDNVEFN